MAPVKGQSRSGKQTKQKDIPMKKIIVDSPSKVNKTKKTNKAGNIEANIAVKITETKGRQSKKITDAGSNEVEGSTTTKGRLRQKPTRLPTKDVIGDGGQDRNFRLRQRKSLATITEPSRTKNKQQAMGNAENRSQAKSKKRKVVEEKVEEAAGDSQMKKTTNKHEASDRAKQKQQDETEKIATKKRSRKDVKEELSIPTKVKQDKKAKTSKVKPKVVDEVNNERNQGNAMKSGTRKRGAKTLAETPLPEVKKQKKTRALSKASDQLKQSAIEKMMSIESDGVNVRENTPTDIVVDKKMRCNRRGKQKKNAEMNTTTTSKGKKAKIETNSAQVTTQKGTGKGRRTLRAPIHVNKLEVEELVAKKRNAKDGTKKVTATIRTPQQPRTRRGARQLSKQNEVVKQEKEKANPKTATSKRSKKTRGQDGEVVRSKSKNKDNEIEPTSEALEECQVTKKKKSKAAKNELHVGGPVKTGKARNTKNASLKSKQMLNEMMEELMVTEVGMRGNMAGSAAKLTVAAQSTGDEVRERSIAAEVEPEPQENATIREEESLETAQPDDAMKANVPKRRTATRWKSARSVMEKKSDQCWPSDKNQCENHGTTTIIARASDIPPTLNRWHGDSVEHMAVSNLVREEYHITDNDLQPKDVSINVNRHDACGSGATKDGQGDHKMDVEGHFEDSSMDILCLSQNDSVKKTITSNLRQEDIDESSSADVFSEQSPVVLDEPRLLSSSQTAIVDETMAFVQLSNAATVTANRESLEKDKRLSLVEAAERNRRIATELYEARMKELDESARSIEEMSNSKLRKGSNAEEDGLSGEMEESGDDSALERNSAILETIEKRRELLREQYAMQMKLADEVINDGDDSNVLNRGFAELNSATEETQSLQWNTGASVIGTYGILARSYQSSHTPESSQHGNGIAVQQKQSRGSLDVVRDVCGGLINKVHSVMTNFTANRIDSPILDSDVVEKEESIVKNFGVEEEWISDDEQSAAHVMDSCRKGEIIGDEEILHSVKNGMAEVETDRNDISEVVSDKKKIMPTAEFAMDTEEIMGSSQKSTVFVTEVSKDGEGANVMEISNDGGALSSMDDASKDEDVLKTENVVMQKCSQKIERLTQENGEPTLEMGTREVAITTDESPKLAGSDHESEKLVEQATGTEKVAGDIKRSAVSTSLQWRFHAQHKRFWERGPSIQEHAERIKQRYLKHQAQVPDIFQRLAKCKESTSETSLQIGTKRSAGQGFDLSDSSIAGPSSVSFLTGKFHIGQTSKERRHPMAAHRCVSLGGLVHRPSRLPCLKMDVKTLTKQHVKIKGKHSAVGFTTPQSERRISKGPERVATPRGIKPHPSVALMSSEKRARTSGTPGYKPHKHIPAFVDTTHMNETQYANAVKSGVVQTITSVASFGQMLHKETTATVHNQS